jgi:hypothetical protein
MSAQNQQSAEEGKIRILGYALPPEAKGQKPLTHDGGTFELCDVAFGSKESFLDYDGVVTFAGVFEQIDHDTWDDVYPRCKSEAELGLRERQFYTLMGAAKPVVFLVPWIHTFSGSGGDVATVDLFRRLISHLGIEWGSFSAPEPALTTDVPEFQDYMRQFGAGYAFFKIPEKWSQDVRLISAKRRSVFGFSILDKAFFLPSVTPNSHAQAVQIAMAAVEAVIAYRGRVSKALPKWTHDFKFTAEVELRKQAQDLRERLCETDAAVDTYSRFKGVLCYQSEPLVDLVFEMLRTFFGIALMRGEGFVDDATLLDESGKTVAVFEIKGVKADFGRADINQVDDHRERLRLSNNTPGVLIMNTRMSAHSIRGKDKAPHPDIIEKAVAERVLLIRTLDLIRLADQAEQGTYPPEGLREAMLGDGGWLKVDDDGAQVVKR